MSVAVRGLTKRFAAGSAPAVADVSFDAPHGAITALLGPSGAGKSTILRIIAGLETADAGTVEIDGEDVTAAPARARGVGLVFQHYALFDHMSVRRNVGFGLAVRGARREETAARVNELLALVRLDGLAHRRPPELSGGERQRVAFARALAVRPRLLLLDEPFGALDASVRRELREWLHALHAKTGVTTLLVTHDQGEALELAGHVVMMLAGQVAQAGAPHDVYDHPATPAVASFLGEANVLDGRSFVRPHDVRLARPDRDETGVVGRVRTLRRVGGVVRLSVALPGGEAVTVETPKDEADALGIRAGDPVGVDLRAARAFDAALEGLQAARPVAGIPSRPLPTSADAASLLEDTRGLLLPEAYGRAAATSRELAAFAERLRAIVARERHASCGGDAGDPRDCPACAAPVEKTILALLTRLPALRELLDGDLAAALAADPAARSAAEVALCYPGFLALIAQRLAHALWTEGAPLTARLLTEHVHSRTGIDLHPGAALGARLFIDHGTGLVVGETTVIGAGVRLHQGVTLGAPSSAAGAGARRGVKRHPTLEDDVIVYANATILGDVVIGRGAIVGGNCWITTNVPPGARVWAEHERRESEPSPPTP
ncbi:MAG: TOBE-like domain-containing protein [Planctomycetes bacterium]|nr:TOBE-like domain-containing protein [Planctomycetota bacterium]